MAGTTSISGENIIKMFDTFCYNQKTEEQFNAATNMMAATWNTIGA